MSASIMSDPFMIATLNECPAAVSKVREVESVECGCCGLTEECTPAYIEGIRARYNGKWICGLCAEAVKEEIAKKKRLISTEEAMNRHTNFCKKFVAAGPPPDSTVCLISAMKQIMRKSLDSPRGSRSNPSTPVKRTDSMRRSSLPRSIQISDGTLSLIEAETGGFF